MYLLDTNVISEMRKANTNRCSPSFATWLQQTDLSLCYLSAMSLFETEVGILRKERRDPAQGRLLRTWFEEILKPEFFHRILPVSSAIALHTAQFHVPNPAAVMDSFIAATAIEHRKILVTRNVKGFAGYGLTIINPFTS